MIESLAAYRCGAFFQGLRRMPGLLKERKTDMIVQLKPRVKTEQMDQLIAWFRGMGVDVHVSQGSLHVILGLIGDTSRLDMDMIRGPDIQNP